MSFEAPASAYPSITKAPRLLSCLSCSRRKIRCDKKTPCSNCVKSRSECISASSQPPKRRKRRFPEAELLARLRFYEKLLKEKGVNLEDLSEQINSLAIRDETRSSHSPSIQSQSSENTTEESGKFVVSGKNGNGVYLNNNLWTGLSDEFQNAEEVLPDSSEDEMDDNAPVTAAYGTLYPVDGGGHLFRIHSSKLSVTALHPGPVEIFKLWQCYIENVNPLIKILHVPSTQKDLLSHSGDLTNIPKSMEALMFAIYSMAITSLENDQCLSTFGEPKDELLPRYQAAAQQALINAGYLKSSDIMVLQAFTLYLLSIRHKIDPRSLWLMTGIAVRSAQRMGLQLNTIQLPPFQIEFRRRLWWQIVILDARAAELSGVGASILAQDWSTPMPLNVNDSDLYPEMKSLPKVQNNGITEMSFVLIRCEIGTFLQNSKLKQKNESGFNGQWAYLSSPQVAVEAKDKAINDLEQTLQTKYISHCDPQRPLDLMTKAMAISIISKMKLVAHHPRQRADRGANLTYQERENLMNSALSMIEEHNNVINSPLTKGYLWHLKMSLPLDAYIYLSSELRINPVGSLADRGWAQIIRIFELCGVGEVPRIDQESGLPAQSYTSKGNNTFDLALSSLTVSAWEAREDAIRRSGGVPPPPSHFICQLKEVISPKKKQELKPSLTASSQDYNNTTLNADVNPSYPTSQSYNTTTTINTNNNINNINNYTIPDPQIYPYQPLSQIPAQIPQFDFTNSTDGVLIGDDGTNMMDWDFWDVMVMNSTTNPETVGFGEFAESEFGFS